MSTQTSPQITDTDLERRAELVRGLRELAQFYEDHPEVPFPTRPGFTHCVLGDDAEGVAVVEAVAATLGIEAIPRGNRVEAERQFGSLNFRVYHVFAEAMRRHYAEASYAGAVQPDDEKAVA